MCLCPAYYSLYSKYRSPWAGKGDDVGTLEKWRGQKHDRGRRVILRCRRAANHRRQPDGLLQSKRQRETRNSDEAVTFPAASKDTWKPSNYATGLRCSQERQNKNMNQWNHTNKTWLLIHQITPYSNLIQWWQPFVLVEIRQKWSF